MDSVGGELSKPAREISEFSLSGNLDAALRASSAQYDAPDQINRLRVKLDLSQANDSGELALVLPLGKALICTYGANSQRKDNVG